MEYYYFYKITNKINGKYYYGVHSTDNLNDGYMGSGVVLNNAIKKYGVENFSKTIIKFFQNTTDMYDYEALIVDENVINDPMCYNLKCGGIGGMKGYHPTKETREKTSSSLKISMNDPDVKERQKKSLKLYYSKAKSREKASLVAKEYYKKPGSREKVSIGNKKRYSNPDERLKTSIASKKVQNRPDVKERKSKSMKNSFTEERRKQVSENSKGRRWINNGEINKFVKECDLEYFLENGFVRGHI